MIQVRFNGADAVIDRLPSEEQATITAEFQAIRKLPGVLDGNQLRGRAHGDDRPRTRRGDDRERRPHRRRRCRTERLLHLRRARCARETADMLGTTEVAANRLLSRARDGLPPLERNQAPLPESPAERELVDRFVRAFQAGDVAGVLATLADDALLTMPPAPLVYQGPAAIGRFLSTVPAGGRLEQFRLVQTRANGQPAFGCYLRDPHASIGHAYGLMVLTLACDRIAAITGFPDTSVFRAFDLPRTIAMD
jgi:hypothetical protein